MATQDADGDHATDDDTARALRAVRRDADPIALEQARIRAERLLFRDPAPPRVGRFVLLGPLAAGGMGVVYRAYDPQLDRKVAVKRIHPGTGDSRQARDRMAGEARALAQLTHPNVVPIYDVVELDDQVMIVMELVDGDTLAAWQRARARPWREVVAIYAAAGRGLAAAHAVGVVHRDFKPANVVVGVDGRARVLDFGLARVTPIAEVAASIGAAPITATGELVGTPAYMAPEQLTGGAASPASDQFSFCVALYEALFGARPFAGDDAAALIEATRAGVRAPPAGARRVPRWLRGVVARGLAADSAARHPSMARLVEQLDRGRSRRRRWVPVAAGAIATVAAIAAVRRADPLAACDAGAAALDATWNPARRDAIRAALGVTPYGRAITDRVVGALDAYRVEWIDMSRDACVAHRRGAQSSTLFDRRVVCLERRKGELAAAAGVLAAIDHTSIGRAVDVATGLAPIAWCGDVAALTADGDPPRAALRDPVAAVRARVSRAESLERAGRLDAALDVATRAQIDAGELGYAPALIEAASTAGRIQLFRGELAAAVAPLALAEATALEHHQLRAAVIAAARRVYAEGLGGADLAALRRQAAVLEPLSRGLDGDHFARPLLLNNLGTVHLAGGDRAAARRYFELARAELAEVTAPDLELTCVDRNLAMLTDDATARTALVRHVWERLRDGLGADHPHTIAALFAYASYAPDAATALPLAAEACALYARVHPDLGYLRIECEYARAYLTAAAGEATAAIRYDDVTALAAGTHERDVETWGALASGHAALARHDAAGALAAFTAIVAGAAADDDFGDRLRTTDARLGAGLAAQALGDSAAAGAQLERVVVDLTVAAALNEDLTNRLRLEQARAALAEVRNETPVDDSNGP